MNESSLATRSWLVKIRGWTAAYFTEAIFGKARATKQREDEAVGRCAGHDLGLKQTAFLSTLQKEDQQGEKQRKANGEEV
ncbi:hypothetical protein RRF57_000281 [Xylaria bambusicola]|uniref:Uncharacterized protein n=1 Tax=Xylaria bambusicola TaxID=326684 RepID=A0AAN7U3K0_9PEZI